MRLALYGLAAGAATFISASSTLAAGLVIHPKLPEPTIFDRNEFGAEQAWVKAKLDLKEAEAWCSNWTPDEPTAACGKELLKSDGGKIYEASANCRTGELTSIDGSKYTYDGIWDKDPTGLFRGRSRWKDQGGEVVGTSNAEGGVVLSMQWMELCPYGAPLNKQPVKVVLSADDFSGSGEMWDHNGSAVFVDSKMGTITYRIPKSSLAPVVQEHTLLFRGTVVHEGPVHGVAYAFKKGCKPAPYIVDGGYDANQNQFVLTGAAPKRDGCNVVGYSEKSPNAKLVFKALPY